MLLSMGISEFLLIKKKTKKSVKKDLSFSSLRVISDMYFNQLNDLTAALQRIYRHAQKYVIHIYTKHQSSQKFC